MTIRNVWPKKKDELVRAKTEGVTANATTVYDKGKANTTLRPRTLWLVGCGNQ